MATNACILWIEKKYVEYDTEIEVVTWKNRKEFVNKRGKNEELVCLRQERGRTKIQYVECMWNVNATVVIDTDKNNNLGGLTGMK